MLGPGASGKISVANAMKNRGFRQEGSGDKQDSNVQYHDPEKLAILQQESAKLQKELDAYNKKHDRCESMLDRHRRKLLKKAEKAEKKSKKKKKKSKKDKKSKKSRKRKHESSSSDSSSSSSDDE